ncbi:MAG: DHHW family protein [Oscillospiraceae bacterium]
MKKPINKIFFVLFVSVWCLIAVLNLAKPYSDFSENENRYLAKFPVFSWSAFIEGDFMRDIDNFLNDHFIFRDAWITVQSSAEYAIGKRETNSVYIGKGSLLGKIKEPDKEVVAGNLDGLRVFSERFKKPIYLMVVPSAAAIQTQKLPDFAVPTDELTAISDIESRSDFVRAVNISSALLEHSDEYIYYRTDHHWTTYGAYLAYAALCDTLNATPLQYSAATVSDSFNGTLYSRSGVRFIKSDSIESFTMPFDGGCAVVSSNSTAEHTSVYFDEYLSEKDKDAYFTGPNEAIVTLYGTNHTGKKLLMFKDSYAHCFAPMLLSMYDEVTLIDLRYLNSLEAYVDIDEYDEVLCLYSFETITQQRLLNKLAY